MGLAECAGSPDVPLLPGVALLSRATKPSSPGPCKAGGRLRIRAGIGTAQEMCTVTYSKICELLPGIRAVSLTSGHSVPSQLGPPARPETSEAADGRERTGLLYDPAPDISHTPQRG